MRVWLTIYPECAALRLLGPRGEVIATAYSYVAGKRHEICTR